MRINPGAVTWECKSDSSPQNRSVMTSVWNTCTIKVTKVMAGFEQECEEGIYCVSCLLTWWTQSFACVELECKLVNVPEKVGSRLRNVCGQLVLTALAVHLEDMKVWVAERQGQEGDIGACPFRSGYWGIGTDLEKCEP